MRKLVSPTDYYRKGLFLLSLLAIMGFMACEDDNGMTGTIDFDRAAMLESVANNLIIPNFESLQTSVNDLAIAAEAFVQTSSEENLSDLRTAWVQAATNHQHCSAFSFGPAELLLGPYTEVLGVFPVNETKVETNILNPDFDLPNSFDVDVRGFYTVEYLIFGNSQTDAELIAAFDQARKDYLLLIIGELKTTFDTIVSGWNGGYLETFTSNTSTAAGSPISLYYNAFVKDYENLKNFKVELPAGLTVEQTGPDGTLVEALYSGISRDLLLAHFENCKNVWLGMSRGGEEIIGWEDYLEAAVGGPELISSTKEALSRIDATMASLPMGQLSDNVADESLRLVRDELQNNTANFKSSMVSLLGLTITFNSGDGD